jgi:hypothetical protein
MSEQVSKHSMTKKPPRVPSDPYWDVYPRGKGVELRGLTEGAPFKPGDFILTHDNSWTSRLIRFGQRLRYRGEEAQFARFNHAAIIVSANGQIVEAVGAGVKLGHIDDYKQEEYVLVEVSASHEDRLQAVRYANYCVGAPYGWFTILSLAWTLLTGGRFSFGVLGSHICSGLVAGALERTGAIWDRPNDSIMPADLARYYDVKEGV